MLQSAFQASLQSCLLTYVIGIDILFPTSPILKWSLANLSEIDCDTGGYQDVGKHGLRIKSYAPLLRDNYTADGYLCIKTVLTTECTENFFGSQSIKYYTDSSRISDMECSESILSWLKGDYKASEHPAASCSWLRTSAESNIQIEVRPHPVLFDPYEGNKISDLFTQGKCNKAHCYTNKEGVMWMSIDNHLPRCLKETLSQVYIFARKGEKGQYSFWNPDYPLQSTKRMCVRDFCGMSGFSFDDGTWIGISKDEIPKDDKLGEFLYKVDKCDQGVPIKAQPEEILIHSVEHTVFG